MFKRGLFRKLLPAVAFFMVITACPVRADDILPMEEIPVVEDNDWSEDGELGVRALMEKSTENNVIETRLQTYLSSGVSSTVYKAVEMQGVDVSHHQQLINWKQVKASGMKFAMIRVGYRGYESGGIAKDTYFETNIQNALAEGMKVGIYFFSQALSEKEAYEEASYTINLIKKYNITYPVVFDWETAPGYRTYNVGLTPGQMNTIATKFCETVMAQGYIPMVYSNTVDFKNRFHYPSLSARFYIWYARYLPEYGGTVWYQSGNRLPNYDNDIKFNMWQYMSDGTVPGINGNCDVNVTFLDFGTKREEPPKPVIKEITLSTSDGSLKIDESASTIQIKNENYNYGQLVNAFSSFYVSVNGSTIISGGNTLLKTGDVLTFRPKSANTRLKKSNYSIYISGDVNADGTITVLDMEEVQKHLLGMSVLSGMRLNAAKVSGSADLSVLDMEKIQKYLLGMEKIN